MKKWKLAFYIYTSQTSVPRTRMGRIPWMARTYLKVPLIFHIYLHCVQTDPAKKCLDSCISNSGTEPDCK